MHRARDSRSYCAARGSGPSRALGYEDIVFSDPAAHAKDSGHPLGKAYAPTVVTYSLPSDVGRDPSLWYILNLHLQMAFRQDSGDGRALILAEPNQTAAAMIEMQRRTIADGDAPSVRWRAFGLIDGAQGGTSTGAVETRFSNFMVTASVRPGINHVYFAVGERGDAELGYVRILDDSSIEIATTAPPKLGLVAEVSDANRSDEVLRIRYTIRNDGGFPVKRAKVIVHYPVDTLQLLDTSDSRAVTIPPHTGADGVLSFRTLGPFSPVTVRLEAYSENAGRARTSIQIFAQPGRSGRLAATSIVGLIVFAAMLPLFPYRRFFSLVRRVVPITRR